MNQLLFNLNCLFFLTISINFFLLFKISFNYTFNTFEIKKIFKSKNERKVEKEENAKINEKKKEDASKTQVI